MQTDHARLWLTTKAECSFDKVVAAHLVRIVDLVNRMARETSEYDRPRQEAYIRQLYLEARIDTGLLEAHAINVERYRVQRLPSDNAA